MYYQHTSIFYRRILRKSSKDEQRRQFHSISAQRTRFEEFEHQTGAVCLGEYVIKSSAKDGKNFESDEFKKLWSDTKKTRHQTTHVLWLNVDRFGRSGKAIHWFEAFRDIGVEVNFITEWFDFTIPEMLRQFYGRVGDAQAEILRLGKRTRAGKAGLRDIGYYNDALPPCWTYEAARRIDGRKYAVKVEPQFTAYKIATEAFAAGMRQTDAMRVAKKKTGYQVSSSAFSRFLRSPLPYGFVPIWNSRNIPIAARIMIDMKPCLNVPVMFEDISMFYAIKERLDSSQSISVGTSKKGLNQNFPLTIKCPTCLATMRGYFANPKRKTPTPYYDCKGCGKVSRINRNKADRLIAAMLNKIEIPESQSAVMEKGVKRGLSASGVNDAKTKERLVKSLNEIKAKIAHLDDNLTRLSIEVYNESRTALMKQKVKAEAELSAFEQTRAAGLDLRAKIIKIINNLGDWYLSQATGKQKAALMDMLFPLGYTVTSEGCRTWYVNQIMASMCSLPDIYVKRESDLDVLLSKSPVSGGNRHKGRTIQADIIVMKRFVAATKKRA